MPITAIILCSDSAENGATAKWCTREIASMPLYKHCILSASKAGIKKFVFLGCGLKEEIENGLREMRQIECDRVWYDRETSTSLSKVIADEIPRDETFFIIKANYLFDYRILDLLARNISDNKIAVVAGQERSTRVENSLMKSMFGDVNLQDKIGGGVIATSRKILTILNPQIADLSIESLLEMLERANLLKSVVVKEFLHEEVDSELSLLSSEKKLYQSLGSSSDSPVLDTYIIRRISKFISRKFLKTTITPNQVTIISLALGLLSGFLFSFGEFTYGISGGVLYFLSVIFDQCDGEIARLKYMESESGRILDIFTDTVVNAAIVVGITAGIYKNDGSGFNIILGLLAMLGISVSLLLMTFFKKKDGGNDRSDEFFDKLNNKDFFYFIIILCILTNKMVWFLWVMAIGTNLYWLALRVVYPVRRLIFFSARREKI